jgi:hypothetical protein
LSHIARVEGIWVQTGIDYKEARKYADLFLQMGGNLFSKGSGNCFKWE